jgi:hypothetical protein
LPETNVPITRFPHPDGIAEVDQYDRDAGVHLTELLYYVQAGLVGQTQVQDNDIRTIFGGAAKTFGAGGRPRPGVRERRTRGANSWAI